ncbi:MAG: 3-keto-5-aminohexanoate cleavage protein [Gemmatimonadetes bacterium]|nr:3-keto-5-aminohexanoate cleavage protein [Gemmatimonadota bacterium]
MSDAPLRSPRAATEIDDCWPVTFGMVETFAREMQSRGIKPELETYHSGGVAVVRHLIDRGLIAAPYWIQTVMGYQAASPPTVQAVLDLLRDFPDDTLWLCSGIGPHQLPLTTLALLMGGHVRVGLEDNIYYRRGELADSNAQLVARTARQAKELNRAVATAAEARAMLGLPAAAAYETSVDPSATNPGFTQCTESPRWDSSPHSRWHAASSRKVVRPTRSAYLRRLRASRTSRSSIASTTHAVMMHAAAPPHR